MRLDDVQDRGTLGSAAPSTHRRDQVGAPTVTVIVPARNEERSIEACLRSILDQRGPALEVIVVDGNSEDRTAELVEDLCRRDPRVRLLRNPDRTIPRSLNLALAAARGRWLVRVDAHATIPPGYVARVAALLDERGCGGVGGRKIGVGRSPTGNAIAAAMGSRFGVGDSRYHYGTSPGPVDHVPFGAYPVALARELGGWDERLRVNQDFEFDHRVREAGHEVYFDPALEIRWESRQTIRELFHQYRRYGAGKAKVALLHPRSVRLRHLAAPGLLLSWAAAAVLALAGRSRAAAVVASPYPFALGIGTAVTARQVHGVRAKVAVPLAFIAMHVGWGMGILVALLQAALRREVLSEIKPGGDVG